LVGTFSIVAIDKNTGLMGVAVTSGSIAVGTRVPWAKPEVGVIATQAYTNTMYGKEGLKLLERGKTPGEALSELLSLDPKPEIRQVCIMNDKGVFAVHTGENCPPYYGHILGDTFCVLGNLLTSKNVLRQVYLAYLENESENFPLRLLKALKAGVLAGGDRRGHNSAAIVIVETEVISGRTSFHINIRVDRSSRPVDELIEKVKLFYDKIDKHSP